MLSMFKGKQGSEAAVEKVRKLHELIVSAVEKESGLQRALEKAKLDRATAMLEAAEQGAEANGATKILVRDLQDDLEDQRALISGLMEKKMQAIREYHRMELKERLARRDQLQKKADEILKKIDELNEKIKQLSQEHEPIYSEIVRINDLPLTFERTYSDGAFGGFTDPLTTMSQGHKLEDRATLDAFLPLSPAEWQRVCKKMRDERHLSVYVDASGDVIW